MMRLRRILTGKKKRIKKRIKKKKKKQAVYGPFIIRSLSPKGYSSASHKKKCKKKLIRNIDILRIKALETNPAYSVSPHIPEHLERRTLHPSCCSQDRLSLPQETSPATHSRRNIQFNSRASSFQFFIDESDLPEPESMSKPAYIRSRQSHPLESGNKPLPRERLTPSAPRLLEPNPTLQPLAHHYRLHPCQPKPDIIMRAARHDAARPAPKIDGLVPRPAEDALRRPRPVVHVLDVPRRGEVVIA
ncbi:hypothetical protein LZ32DRAFT_178841 [Colletotrichum eremochloae]|nr:hypothetical protein LZ32DRAFT_178841 [Colletotrichum eremochloae]